MLDSLETYKLDTTQLAQSLENLPYSYVGSSLELLAPYGLIGYGEGAWASEVARDWIDNTIVEGGTQFVLLGGLDFGQAEIAMLLAESRNSKLYRMGTGHLESRALKTEKGLTLKITQEPETLEQLIPASPFSSYTYLQALAYATGQSSSAKAADQVLYDLLDRCKTEIHSETNPAKQLAWKLWTRTPILLASPGFEQQIWAWQEMLSRVAKSLSIPIERNPLTVIASGFEARHETGDGLVALLLGSNADIFESLQELLETRVAEVIQVPAPEAEKYPQQLGLWYFGAWVSYYLALLYSADPQDSSALVELRASQ